MCRVVLHTIKTTATTIKVVSFNNHQAPEKEKRRQTRCFESNTGSFDCQSKKNAFPSEEKEKKKDEAVAVDRTRDLLITSQMRYHCATTASVLRRFLCRYDCPPHLDIRRSQQTTK